MVLRGPEPNEAILKGSSRTEEGSALTQDRAPHYGTRLWAAILEPQTTASGAGESPEEPEEISGTEEGYAGDSKMEVGKEEVITRLHQILLEGFLEPK